MSRAPDLRRMRMEMLRMRGMVERAEATAAVMELRQGAGKLRSFAGAASAVGAAMSTRGGWLGLVVSTLTRKPWAAAAALAAVRSLKKHPLLGLVVAGAAALGAGVSRRRRRKPPPSE